VNRPRKLWISTLALAIAFFTITALSFAADSKPQQVTVDPIQPVKLIKGTPGKAEIRFRVNSGFHINSNKPTSDLLIPTTVEFAPNPAIKVGAVRYPAGQDFSIPIAPDEKLNVYAGDVNIVAPLTVAKTTANGTYNLKATLTYQACSDNACFPPKKVPLEFVVKVETSTKK
jgi:DsbC/DsbD-like thiol-disulfide interchange protein